MKIKVIKIEEDTARNLEAGKRITLERDDGKKFAINIPNERWVDEPKPYGLNLVFDHSGQGDHYE